MKNRILRLNSLLKEVISEVVRSDMRDPRIHPLITITKVEITADLRHAKVFFSVIGNDKEKQDTLEALESGAGFIALSASKKMVIRFFPELTFKIDNSVEQQMRVEELLGQIHKEQQARKGPPSSDAQ